MIRIVIAEDQAMLLGALAALLELETDIKVVYRATDGQDALNFLLSPAGSQIDLVITDIEMPKLSGIELAQAIQQHRPRVKLLVLTTFARSGYLRRAMDAGVKGYLLKESPSDQLIVAIRKIMQGGRMVAPELMEQAWMEVDPLSEKERQALKCAREGDTTEQIAAKLHLSPGTIRNYLSSAASKLGAKNRVEAARIAHQNGWL